MAALERTTPGTWRHDDEPGLDGDSLQALFDNEIPAIRIAGFATAEECGRFARGIRDVGMQHVYRFKGSDDRQLSTVQTGYIGLTHYNYRHKPPEAYFAEVPEAYAHRDRVLARSFDAVGRMTVMLSAASGRKVGVASEPGHGRLYAGIIRDATTGGDLHADYAPFTAPGLSIGGIDAQISWNLWLEHPSEGGLTTVHNRPWDPDRSGPRVPENYPLDHALVAGAQSHTYRPKVGDAILFNTRNPHEISAGAEGAGRRLQIGSFVGRMPDGSLVLWS